MAHHVCPWWMGYLLANPLRNLIQNPSKIVSPYVQQNMKVLDIGCGMGFFTIPMARMVGDTGRVYAVDLQYKMLKGLKKRAYKAGVIHCIEPRECETESLGLEDLKSQIGFVLLFAVIHEVPDPQKVFSEVCSVLKSNGSILFAEPSGHVPAEQYELSLQIARNCGLNISENLTIKNSHAVLLKT